MKNKYFSALIALFFSTCAMAQETAPQMAEGLRSDGKIYVVIGVVAIVFICLISYLIYIDVKLKRLEKEK